MSELAAGMESAPVAGGADQPRIGPNAITRIEEALRASHGAGACERVFSRASLMHYLGTPPTRMVPDADVALLHSALVSELGADKARLIGAEAGRLTARYLLANRIPRLAQVVLGFLPAHLGMKLLLKAIGGHAWTFAGAGSFSYRCGRSVVLAISGGPVSRHLTSDAPVCDYYAATFETLFRVIISQGIRVHETACEAQGAAACVFTVRMG